MLSKKESTQEYIQSPYNDFRLAKLNPTVWEWNYPSTKKSNEVIFTEVRIAVALNGGEFWWG